MHPSNVCVLLSVAGFIFGAPIVGCVLLALALLTAGVEA
jgi:hypothetical protein